MNKILLSLLILTLAFTSRGEVKEITENVEYTLDIKDTNGGTVHYQFKLKNDIPTDPSDFTVYVK